MRLSEMNILLVEDNELNAEIAKAQLQMAGVNVTWADCGQKAIEQIMQQRFDLVLMDIVMPGLNGYETTKQIRQLEHTSMEELRIVALTSNDSPEEIAACIEAGMNEHMAKPLDVRRLEEICQMIC